MADDNGTASATDGGTTTQTEGSEGASNEQNNGHEPDPLGDAGKAALTAERRARSAAEKQVRTLAAEIEQLKTATQSDQERAVTEARREGEKAGIEKGRNMLKRAAVLSAAAGKFANPDLAIRLVDLDDIEISDEGEIDSKAINAAIADLLKAEPYLAAAGSKPGPLPGGGATPSTGNDLEAAFLRAIKGQS